MDDVVFPTGKYQAAGTDHFFITFIGIVIYVYGNKKRGKRLESYRDSPFLDDQEGSKDKQ